MAGLIVPPTVTRITGLDGYSDVLRGTGGAEHILGLSGNGLLAGAGGDDILEGGVGDDLIAGGAGCDLVYGGTRRDDCRSGAIYSPFIRSASDHEWGLAA